MTGRDKDLSEKGDLMTKTNNQTKNINNKTKDHRELGNTESKKIQGTSNNITCTFNDLQKTM